MPGFSRWYSAQMDDPANQTQFAAGIGLDTPRSPPSGRCNMPVNQPNEPSTYSESSTGCIVFNENGCYAQAGLTDVAGAPKLDIPRIAAASHAAILGQEQFVDCHSSHDVNPPTLVETSSLNFCAKDERLPWKIRIMDTLDSMKAHLSCFQDWISGALHGDKSTSKLSSELARTEIEYQDLFHNSSGVVGGDSSASWCKRHWKLLLVVSIVTVVFLAVGLTVVLAIVVPRQIEKLLRTSVLITESTEIANAHGSEFTVIVKGQLISGSSIRASISPGDTPISVRQVIQRKSQSEVEGLGRRLMEANTTESDLGSNKHISDDWRDPFTFVKPSDRLEDLGTIVLEPFTVLGRDQEIVGHLDIDNRAQFSSCVKNAISGQTAWWILSGSTNVHVAGVTFQNIPFNRVFKLNPPSALDASHVVVTSVDLMEDPAVAGSIGLEKQTSNMPILIEGHVLNTGNLEIADFGSASFELKYRDVSIGTLHTPHLGFLHGLNPLRLRGYLLPGKELQQIFSNYLHGVSNVLTITISAIEENVLQSAIQGLTITQALPMRPDSSGSAISHMFLEKIQLSPTITRSASTLDAYNRVMLDDGTLSRERFPSWPQDLVLMTPSKEERRMLKQRVRRYRRLLKEDGVKIKKREARQTMWRDMQNIDKDDEEIASTVPTGSVAAKVHPEPLVKTYPVELQPRVEDATTLPGLEKFYAEIPAQQAAHSAYESDEYIDYRRQPSHPSAMVNLNRIRLNNGNNMYIDPIHYSSVTDEIDYLDEVYANYDPSVAWHDPLWSLPTYSREEAVPREWLNQDFYVNPDIVWNEEDYLRVSPYGSQWLPQSNYEHMPFSGRHLRFLQESTEGFDHAVHAPMANGPVETPINSILSAVVNVVGNTFGRAKNAVDAQNMESEQSLDGQQNVNTNNNNLAFLGDLTKAISSTVLQAVRGGANQGLKTAADFGDILSSNGILESAADEGETGGISITNIGVIKWREPVAILIQRACAHMGNSFPIETRVIVGFWSPFYETKLVETDITGELAFRLGSKTFDGNSIIATGKPEPIRKGTDQYTCEKNLRLHGSKQISEVTEASALPMPNGGTELKTEIDDSFVLGAVSHMGIIKGQYMMERVNLKSSLSIQPDQLSVLGSQMLEAHQLSVEARNMDISARVTFNKEEFEVYENNRTQRLSFGGKPLDSKEHAMDLRVRRLSIPPSASELTLIVELTITLNLPIEIEVESPIYLNWMSQDIVGGPLTIPRLKLRRGANEVIAYIGFYKERLGQLVLPMALQMYREGTFNVCLTSRSTEEISEEERQVQQKTASVFSDALNIMLAGLVSYCTRVPLGKSETRMLGDVFLPFVTQLTKTIHV